MNSYLDQMLTMHGCGISHNVKFSRKKCYISSIKIFDFTLLKMTFSITLRQK